MTLSGLALAVGILVDEATVAIENIHTHLAAGKAGWARGRRRHCLRHHHPIIIQDLLDRG